MESTDFEETIVCPDCKAEQLSLFFASDTLSDEVWTCLNEGCSGARRLQCGFCCECNTPVVVPWRQGRQKLVCRSCDISSPQSELSSESIAIDVRNERQSQIGSERSSGVGDHGFAEKLKVVSTRIDDFEKQFEQLLNLVTDVKTTLPDPEVQNQRFLDLEQSLGNLEKSIERVQRRVESVNQHTTETQGKTIEEFREGQQKLLAHLKNECEALRSGASNLSKSLETIPRGDLNPPERQILADLISKETVSRLSLTLLGKKKSKENEPAHADVSSMVRTHLTNLVCNSLAELQSSVSKLEHRLVAAVAEATTESLGTSRARGKDEKSVVMSVNLAAMEDFVDSAKKNSLLTAVKNLPEMFNRIEVDLKHQQEELNREGNDQINPASVQLLQAIEEYFVNWQRQNNIVRFPEKTGEAIVLRMHDIVETTPTADRDLHRLIARVDQHGYLLRDKYGEFILQKAEVAVWDFCKRD